MKKIMFCIITGILLLNSIIATGMMTDNISNDDSSTIISGGQEEEWIPTIGEIHIKVDFDERFDCILTGYDNVTINNWTAGNTHKVKVKWDVEGTGKDIVIVNVRIREWKKPLSVAIFFLFARYGNIKTPNYRRSYPIAIDLTKGNQQNESIIEIEINEDISEITGAAFFWTIHPRMNGLFNTDWSSIYIK